MPYLNVGSLRLYFEVEGTGHPILLLPPLSQGHIFLRPFAKGFAKKYTAISLDPIGHGLSDKPKDEKQYSYENLADHCYGLIQHMEINRHHILGMSWSGRIALTYALRHQEKARALVLIGSSGPKHQPASPPKTPADASDEERFVVETVWKTPYNVTKDLGKIQTPTLILIGDQDPRLEAARLIHANIPRSTLTIFKGLGHEIGAEICLKNVLGWLKELTE